MWSRDSGIRLSITHLHHQDSSAKHSDVCFARPAHLPLTSTLVVWKLLESKYQGTILGLSPFLDMAKHPPVRPQIHFEHLYLWSSWTDTAYICLWLFYLLPSCLLNSHLFSGVRKVELQGTFARFPELASALKMVWWWISLKVINQKMYVMWLLILLAHCKHKSQALQMWTVTLAVQPCMFLLSVFS